MVRWRQTTWLLILLSLAFALLLALPIIALLARAVQQSAISSLSTPATLAALRVSLLTSLTSLGLVIVSGTPLAYILARWQFRGRAWLETLVDLPIVMPPSVAGLALLVAFGRRGLIGALLLDLGISLPFTTAAVVLAQVFVAGPLYVRAVRVGFAAVDEQLEEAALAEGATPIQIFRYVMLPAARGALVSGAILCWARALGEFGATILFAGNLIGRTQTMPLAIYLSLEGDISEALLLAVLMLFISGASLLLLRRLEEHWQVV
ncbi:MAG: molybdate ABC transporter permease subunit [Chloroflexi bacterium]|nr:MAG: molybdate ABC transporter permease subunit [Chloroflexota bacterium]MBL1194611.1 molybdate ABC transporter permease subunit [Chloroflexota bacterium]NOH11901.1 molybdate ABC transporter permease subunit [Chloroflexota bacterium]